MYIGSTGVARPAPPRLRGRRQLGRRGARRPLRRASTVTIHPDNSRHGRRQRPRHPGRDHGEGGQAGRRGRADRPARRRQVRRRRRLQGLRRPARRRRLGRQRAVGAARRRGPPRRPRLDARSYERGVPQGELAKGEPTSETGTTITFLPDAEIFETLDFDFATLEQRLRETAFLTRGLQHHAHRRARRGRTGRVPLRGRHRGLRRATSTRTRTPIQKKVVFFEGESDEGAVEVAMQWNASYQESIFSFANNINTHEGGSHLSGFRSALTRTLNRYAREKGLLKEKDENLTGEDVREGLTAVISVKLADPQFEGQTKTKLGNPGMAGLRRSRSSTRKLAEFLEENPAEAQRDHPQGRLGRPGPRRRAQGARPHAPQVRARELARCRASSPTARCKRPGADRALHRRGRLRRRLGQAGPRPLDAGGPAAARQDPQRREGADRQGARRTTRSRR